MGKKDKDREKDGKGESHPGNGAADADKLTRGCYEE